MSMTAARKRAFMGPSMAARRLGFESHRRDASRPLGEAAQDVVQNPPMPEIFDLVFGVDPTQNLDLVEPAIRTCDLNHQVLAGSKPRQARDRDGLGAGKPEPFPGFA